MRLSKEAILTSATLTAVTLAVFFSAQLVAPAATVRRFVLAIHGNDLQGAQSQVWQKLDSPAGLYLTQMARSIPPGATLDVTRSERMQNSQVVYTEITSGPMPRIDAWVLKRYENQWRIDALATAQARSQGIFQLQ